MPRLSRADNPELFRAHITRTYDKKGLEFTEILGPYDGRSQAQAAITREVRLSERWNTAYKVSGKIQRTSVNWEDLTD